LVRLEQYQWHIDPVRALQNLYTNAIPAAIVIACIYIPLNLAFSAAATGLERRNRRRRISAVPRGCRRGARGRADMTEPADGTG
jgi:hypothetical protein